MNERIKVTLNGQKKFFRAQIWKGEMLPAKKKKR